MKSLLCWVNFYFVSLVHFVSFLLGSRFCWFYFFPVGCPFCLGTGFALYLKGPFASACLVSAGVLVCCFFLVSLRTEFFFWVSGDCSLYISFMIGCWIALSCWSLENRFLSFNLILLGRWGLSMMQIYFLYFWKAFCYQEFIPWTISCNQGIRGY